MEEDLSLSSNEYSISLVVFFVGYVVFEVPSKYVNILSSRITATANWYTVSCSVESVHRYSCLPSWLFGGR